jgi:hypothetical protein
MHDIFVERYGKTITEQPIVFFVARSEAVLPEGRRVCGPLPSFRHSCLILSFRINLFMHA